MHALCAVRRPGQAEEKRQYWVNVLRRVVAVIKFLATRGMPFRGDNELLGSPHYDIFLGLIELLAQFDPFLENHLMEMLAVEYHLTYLLL